MREAVNSFITNLTRNGASPNTIRSYTSILTKNIVKEHSDIKIEDFSKLEVTAILARLREAGKSSYTQINTLRAISALFTYAIEQEWIESNPVKGVKLPTKTNARLHQPVALTAPQLRALIETIPENVRGIFALASWGALRYSEVVALNKTDVDARLWTVRVSRALKRDAHGGLILGNPKSSAGYRTITIPPACQDIVAGAVAAAPAGDPCLFVNPAHPEGWWTDRVLRTILHAACVELGYPRMRFHDLRHTGLTLYGQAGATLADLMARAGHTNADTVMIYQQSSIIRDRELSARMG
ncbi:site-specific integrase [Arcanobacterium hippocoleae]